MPQQRQAGRVRAALEGTQFSEIGWVTETGSTNADLMELARRGAPHGSVLVADHQLAGRGRLDRRWEAAPGQALLASVLMRPTLPPQQAPRLLVALGVAAAEASSDLSGAAVGLKWPNDLVVAKGPAPGKLGGLLAESLVDGAGLQAVVVGLGLNVAWPLDLPSDLAPTVTSIGKLCGEAPSIESVLVAVLKGFELRSAQAVDPRAWPALNDRYRELCTTIGMRVAVETSDGVFRGTATGVTDDGHLVVEVGPGDVREVPAGDVVHLRDR